MLILRHPPASLLRPPVRLHHRCKVLLRWKTSSPPPKVARNRCLVINGSPPCNASQLITKVGDELQGFRTCTDRSRRIFSCSYSILAPSSCLSHQSKSQQMLERHHAQSGHCSNHEYPSPPHLIAAGVLCRLYVVSTTTATWAISPVCGLDNKRVLVRAVVQLLNHTVGVNGRHRSRTLGLGGEAAALAVRPSCCLSSTAISHHSSFSLPQVGSTLLGHWLSPGAGQTVEQVKQECLPLITAQRWTPVLTIAPAVCRSKARVGKQGGMRGWLEPVPSKYTHL